MLKYVIAILSGLVLISCKTQNLLVEKQNPQRIADSIFRYDPSYQYRIRTGDKINISVWGQDQMSVGSIYGIYNSNEVYGKWLMVDAEGNIEIPKLGTRKILNSTVIELKDTLRKELEKWIVNPIVDVKVLNKEITVLGEIKNPGVITVDKDHNQLLELIGKTGGFEFYANLKYVKVIRQEGYNVRVTNIDLTKGDNYLERNILLHPGDMIIVPSKSYKEFDKRISTIIPFTTVVSAAAILFKLF